MSLVQLNGIHKSYRMGGEWQPVLRGIDLTIESGEMVAVMGASGSGKSTLMNIVGLLDVPSQGEYLFQGENVAHLDDDKRAHLRNKNIGFVFQQFFLLPRLNAIQNVALPLQYRQQTGGQDIARQYLERMGVGDKISHRPNELSGGQQQRVAIARALVGEPELILADEPTGALDSKTGEDILHLFIELNQQMKTTIIIVTHDAKVAEHCHRVVHIADGLLQHAETVV